MPVDLAPGPAVADLATRTAAVVREAVVPVEERHGDYTPLGPPALDIAAPYEGNMHLLEAVVFVGPSRGSAAQATAMARTSTAEAGWRVADRSLQVCGSPGVSGDALLGRFRREVRPFRIHDGPSETHRWAIAKRVVGAVVRAR